MASPPPSATSPSGMSPLALPRQRQPLALPGHGQPRSRKHSIASATSAHPLRQTSFPPPDSLEAQHQLAEDAHAVYSPSQGSLDEFSDSEIVSAISGPAEEPLGRKRKRGERRPRGRPRGTGLGGRRTASVSLMNGEEGRKGASAPSVATGTGEAEEEEDDGDDEEVAVGGRLPLYEGGQMSQAELSADNQQRAMFSEHIAHVDSLPLLQRKGLTVADHSSRYEAFGRSKLRVADVRRLVNQTLSQSVPPNIITVVSSYTKLFAGMLIQGAREVQAEWEAGEPKRADGADNPLYKRLRRSYPQDHNPDGKQADLMDSSERKEELKADHTSLSDSRKDANGIKREPDSDSPPGATDNQRGSDESQATVQSLEDGIFPGGAGGLSTGLEECDQGPLQPDHLREAIRRYKKARKGGTVGFTGLSLEGRDVAASRMGGKRLFK